MFKLIVYLAMKIVAKELVTIICETCDTGKDICEVACMSVKAKFSTGRCAPRLIAAGVQLNSSQLRALRINKPKHMYHMPGQ